jgi:outer membrane protein assembly factor BamB
MNPEEKSFTSDEQDLEVMQALRILYSTERQEMDHALLRGRERLAQSHASLLAPQQSQEAMSQRPLVFPTRNSTRPLLLGGFWSEQRPPPKARLVNLVAALLLVIVVGGLTAGLILVRNKTDGSPGKGTPTASVAPTAPSAPVQNNLYLVVKTPLGAESVTKIDPKDHATLWTYQYNGGFEPFGEPIVADGTIYLSGQIGLVDLGPQVGIQGHAYVYALNAETGTLRWKQQLAPDYAAPGNVIVANGIVYAETWGVTPSPNTQNDNLVIHALNASNGLEQWELQITHFDVSGNFPQPLTLSDGVLYSAYTSPDSTDTVVYAVRASDGMLLWQTHAAKQALNFTQAFSDLEVINGAVYVLDAVTGPIPPSAALADARGTNSLAVQPLCGRVCPPTTEYLNAFDKDGKQLWPPQKITEQGIGGHQQSPDGTLRFVSLGDRAYFISTTDSSSWLWSFTFGQVLYSTPVVANGVLYLAGSVEQGGGYDGNNAFVEAFNPQKNTVLWKKVISLSGSHGWGAVIDGVLYFTGLIPPNNIVGLNTNDGSQVWGMKINSLTTEIIAAP